MNGFWICLGLVLAALILDRPIICLANSVNRIAHAIKEFRK